MLGEQRPFGNVCDTGWHDRRGGCYWHPAGRSQGCCTGQFLTPQQRIIQPQISTELSLKNSAGGFSAFSYGPFHPNLHFQKFLTSSLYPGFLFPILAEFSPKLDAWYSNSDNEKFPYLLSSTQEFTAYSAHVAHQEWW